MLSMHKKVIIKSIYNSLILYLIDSTSPLSLKVIDTTKSSPKGEKSSTFDGPAT